VRLLATFFLLHKLRTFGDRGKAKIMKVEIRRRSTATISSYLEYPDLKWLNAFLVQEDDSCRAVMARMMGSKHRRKCAG
jgi:hypothetical protein